MSKKQLQQEKEDRQSQNSKVVPGDAGDPEVLQTLVCLLRASHPASSVTVSPTASHPEAGTAQPAPKTITYSSSWWKENVVCSSQQAHSKHQNTLSGIWKEQNVKAVLLHLTR